jgi:hypothetical protein
MKVRVTHLQVSFEWQSEKSPRLHRVHQRAQEIDKDVIPQLEESLRMYLDETYAHTTCA